MAVEQTQGLLPITLTGGKKVGEHVVVPLDGGPAKIVPEYSQEPWLPVQVFRGEHVLAAVLAPVVSLMYKTDDPETLQRRPGYQSHYVTIAGIRSRVALPVQVKKGLLSVTGEIPHLKDPTQNRAYTQPQLDCAFEDRTYEGTDLLRMILGKDHEPAPEVLSELEELAGLSRNLPPVKNTGIFQPGPFFVLDTPLAHEYMQKMFAEYRLRDCEIFRD